MWCGEIQIKDVILIDMCTISSFVVLKDVIFIDMCTIPSFVV